MLSHKKPDSVINVKAEFFLLKLFSWEGLHNPDFNPLEFEGDMRDAATLNQLLVLANLESYNAVLISQRKNQKERMELLRQLAVQQIQTLVAVSLNNLPKLTENHNSKK
jgi:hypothetical protein